MKAVLQRVSRASVAVDGQIVGEVAGGLLVLLGVAEGDTPEQAALLADKCAKLRIFPDEEDKLNRSLLDVGGQALVVSNFTLYADARKGRRPSYIRAARPEAADALYRRFADCLREQGVARVELGRFGAEMKIALENDGPVTIILDTDELTPSPKP